MPRISYFVLLREQLDRIRVDFETSAGRVRTIHIVQYEAFVDGRWRPIARYDTAHGYFHQDVYTARGRLKYRIAIQDLAQAVTYAIDDLKTNWKQYRRQLMGA